jgi:tripartite-type tricarboxylate transporter receptor subunit TctC
MKTIERLLVGMFVASFFVLSAASLEAENFPSRPIQIVITLAPGDGLDLMARAISVELAKALKTPVMPVNKTGGSGAIGADFVIKGKKDGYAILYVNPNLVYTYAANPENVPFNPLQDLEPLGFAGLIPLLIAVQADSPWKTFQDLLDYIKKNPGKVRGSSTGVGSLGHFCYEVIRSETGAAITMIPYKGASPGFTALLGGHVEVAIPSFSVLAPHLAAGKVRALLTSKKIPEFPNIPTLTQLGYKRDMSSVWNAAFLPSGVPDSVKKILAAALEKSVKAPEVVDVFQKIGAIQDYRSGEELKKSIIEEYGMIKEFFKTSGPPAK